MTRTLYRRQIEAAAAAHGLDADLVEAVVLVESSGQTDSFRFERGFWDLYLKGKEPYATQIPRRVSSSYGLMQCMFAVAVEMGFKDEPERLFVPEIGLEYGCRKLAAELKWANGDVMKALGSYNAGRGGYASAPGRTYAGKVTETLKGLQAPA